MFIYPIGFIEPNSHTDVETTNLLVNILKVPYLRKNGFNRFSSFLTVRDSDNLSFRSFVTSTIGRVSFLQLKTTKRQKIHFYLRFTKARVLYNTVLLRSSHFFLSIVFDSSILTVLLAQNTNCELDNHVCSYSPLFSCIIDTKMKRVKSV